MKIPSITVYRVNFKICRTFTDGLNPKSNGSELEIVKTLIYDTDDSTHRFWIERDY